MRHTDWPKSPHVDPYPRDAAARDEIRALAIELSTVRGARSGLRYGLSLRCLDGDHGCRNDGSTCLCYCHDVK